MKTEFAHSKVANATNNKLFIAKSSQTAKSTVTAAVGLSMLASVGEADIQYSSNTVTVTGGAKHITMGNISFSFDLFMGGIPAQWRGYFYGGGNGSVVITGGAARNFSSGEQIGTGLGFAATSMNFFQYNTGGTKQGFQASRNFDATHLGYLGVKFNDNGTKYGWIHIDSIANDGTSYHINGWAYEDSGGSIRAGDTGQGGSAVPEPSGLALLACGAAGIYALRKKRNGHVSDSKNV